MSKYQQNLTEEEEAVVKAFAGYVRQYCLLIETHESLSADEFIRECASVLPALFKAALELPYTLVVTEEPIDHYVGAERESSICREIDGKLGKYNWYWHVFDPYEEKGEANMIMLSNDLDEIYGDVKSCLMVFDRGAKDDVLDAVWQWRFDFYAHWGDHLTAAMRAVFWLVYMHEQHGIRLENGG